MAKIRDCKIAKLEKSLNIQKGDQNRIKKKNRQHNSQKYKRKNTDLQNIHINLKIV